VCSCRSTCKKNKIEEYLSNNLEPYFGISGDAYGWIYPLTIYYSVGIGGVIKDIQHHKKFLLDFIRKSVFSANMIFMDIISREVELKEELMALKFF